MVNQLVSHGGYYLHGIDNDRLVLRLLLLLAMSAFGASWRAAFRRTGRSDSLAAWQALSVIGFAATTLIGLFLLTV